jgi:hypothetical protein
MDALARHHDQAVARRKVFMTTRVRPGVLEHLRETPGAGPHHSAAMLRALAVRHGGPPKEPEARYSRAWRGPQP